LLATVVANSRQATVILTGDRDRDPDFPPLPGEPGNLRFSPPEGVHSRSTVSNFRRVVKYPAVSVLNLPVRFLRRTGYSSQQPGPETGVDSINTWLAALVTHVHATGLPRWLMIASFKELSGLLSLTW